MPKYDQAGYTHDGTMYSSDKRVSTIIDSLSHEFTILPKKSYNNFIWFLTQINGHLCC